MEDQNEESIETNNIDKITKRTAEREVIPHEN